MKDSQENQWEATPEAIAHRLNLPFSDFLLLSRALTHRSYINEHPEALEDNERLEFLGDAVLDFLVGAWLYHRYPEMTEGDLTRLRSALVRTDQLAAFARQIKLGSVLRLGKGEEESGGRQRPALLCGAFEALVGALYLQSGISTVQDFIEPMLEPAAEQILEGGRDQDPKSRLQEWAQAQGLPAPSYRTVSSRGPDHARIFEVEVLIGEDVYGSGAGHSKQAATKAAAIVALRAFGLE